MCINSYLFCVVFLLVIWMFLNFILIGRELITTLLLIETWWIFFYFLLIFTSLYLNNYILLILTPLVLVFAGLEVVLGFYFLYFL